MMSEPSKTFEDSIHRLEEIVQKMESGDLPLEESLKLFEEGTNLVKSSNKLLDEAELKVAKLIKGADGVPMETEFDEDA